MSDQFQWDGLPTGEMYCWVWGKAPKYDRWNTPTNLFSLDQIKERVFPSHQNATAPTGFGIVSGRWSGTLAVDFDANEAMPERAEETFQNVTGHPSSHLPASATVISGRPNRRRVFLKVPEIWWSALSGYSASLCDLELRWEAQDAASRMPKPIQSVISGPHPDNKEWFFRWEKGLSPEDVGFQEAPTWLLIAIVKQRGVEIGLESNEGNGGGGGAEEPGYIDQLVPKKQKALLDLMSQYWPYRGGAAGTRYQASYSADSFDALLGALNNVLGPQTALQWLEDTKWFSKNEDWGCHTDFVQALRSVGRSKAGRKAGWGTLHFLATRTEDKAGNKFAEPAMILPAYARPPKELEISDIGLDVQKKVKQLKEALVLIDEMDTPLDRAFAYQNLSRSLDLNQKEFQMILTQANEQEKRTVGGDFNEVIANAKPIEVAIERLLAFNALTIVGSDGGVGKSVLLYRIAEAAANGWAFAGLLQTVQGNVLIIQKDESDSNMAQKNQLMRLQIPDGTVRVEFSFNAGMFKELRMWIRQHKAKYVLMDSMVSLFGGGLDLSEGEIGTYMYLLNSMAAEEGCAIVLTHHLRKADKTKTGKRQDITMSDMYGSAFIGAGTSDLWGVIHDPENDKDYPQFLLKVLKPRTGVTQAGDTYLLSGNAEDLSFNIEKLNDEGAGVLSMRNGAKSLLKVLRTRDKGNAFTINELASETRLSDKQIRRLLKEMLSTNRFGVMRVKDSSASGRPTYRYWAE